MSASLRELMLARAEADPDGGYLVDARDGRTLTNTHLVHRADRWADMLARLDVPAGGRVALDIQDPLTFAAVHLSVIAAGRCSAPLDPDAPSAAASRAREALQPALVLTDQEGRVGLPISSSDGLPVEGPSGTHRGSGSGARGLPGSAALLTSGSTGRPKTVVLGEEQMLHVARGVARHHHLTAADRGFNPLPLFHVNAQVVGLLATLVAGSTLVLDRRFHRTGFWALLDAHECTWLNAAPAILSILAGEPVDQRPTRLRFIRSASAPLPTAVRESICARTGVTVVESYGMTEAASQITATPLDGEHRVGSVGRAVDGELRVVDRHGLDCLPGVVGRVRIRGRGVIREYADGAAAASFDHDHWLDTADLGRLDADGHLYLVGRADDVINRGGELVYPREVEEVLGADAEVAEAVVVGRPDPVLGSVPVARVRARRGVLPDGTDGTGEQAGPDHRATAELIARLNERCVEHLARYQRPVEIRVVTGLPTSSTGKIRRAELRRRVAEECGVMSR